MFGGGVITMSELGDPARVPKMMMPPPTSETATGGWEWDGRGGLISCKKLRSECEIGMEMKIAKFVRFFIQTKKLS